MKVERAKDGSAVISVPVVLLAGLVVCLIVLVLIVWSVKHRRDVTMHLPADAPIEDLLPSIAGVTHGVIVPGNSVELIQNGDFFTRLLSDIESARETVHFETFLWHDGETAHRVSDALAARARAGVVVRVLLDASGGKELSKEDDRKMTEAGVKVEKFHRFRLTNLGTINNRDHRKIVVIDGRIGWVGGHCIADDWTGNAQDKKHFRDISVRVTGPIVNQLQSAFSENWIEETGDLPAGRVYFPETQPAGSIPAHLAYVTPAGSSSSVELLHLLAIHAADKSIHIQNPYFLPDPEGLVALERAVKRGVDVRVMLPSADATDNAIVQHASHHHFGTLLQHGVRIWEYDRTLLHQKVMTIDGKWSSVGSTNFDDRSFELNDEVTMGIIDPGIAAQLQAIFEADTAHAREIRLEEWRNRSLWHKMIDGLAYLVNEQL